MGGKKRLVLALLGVLCASTAHAAPKFRIAWSHYTGWEPWGWAAEHGIMKKWADKYGIEVDVVLINDYVESVNLYTGGKFDGVAVTNMDALSIPAVGGIDTTAIIVGDFSDGNDGIVIKGGKSVADLKGKDVKLVALSVSHYLLARALDKEKMSEKDLRVVNTSDADIGSVFMTGAPGTAVVTWNPILMSIRNAAGAALVFDSSKIPGEIIDMLVVKTNADEKLKKAVVGAWYETMAVMSGTGKAADEAIAAMAAKAGGTEAEFRAQLKTTKMFYRPAEAAAFTEGPELKATMKYVAQFSFDHGLYGEGAKSADVVGIRFPDGTVQGSDENVKLRFDASFMKAAADGKL